MRPSLWVEPQESWGRGSVELVEIPSDKETHDNIVAFWRPATPLQAGRRYDYAYRLHWLSLPPDAKLLARVAATRIGRSLGGERRLIVVDFDHMGTVPRAVHAEVSASVGAIANVNGQAIAPTHQYRASFELDPQNESVIELRLMLMTQGEPWSETWLYRWTR